jgi:hypothetical protein
MNITIRIIYQGYTSRIMRRGSFPVDPFEFEVNPNQEAVRVAMEFLKMIRKEGHIEEILEVVYNGDKDITELVIKLDKAPLDDY